MLTIVIPDVIPVKTTTREARPAPTPLGLPLRQEPEIIDLTTPVVQARASIGRAISLRPPAHREFTPVIFDSVAMGSLLRFSPDPTHPEPPATTDSTLRPIPIVVQPAVPAEASGSATIPTTHLVQYVVLCPLEYCLLPTPPALQLPLRLSRPSKAPPLRTRQLMHQPKSLSQIPASLTTDNEFTRPLASLPQDTPLDETAPIQYVNRPRSLLS
jgi:hypothetical protein